MSMWVARCHYPILFVSGHASQLVYKKAREWRVHLSSFTCILHACVFVLALLHFLLSFVHFQYGGPRDGGRCGDDLVGELATIL